LVSFWLKNNFLSPMVHVKNSNKKSFVGLILLGTNHF
jgi:hypothetical protein